MIKEVVSGGQPLFFKVAPANSKTEKMGAILHPLIQKLKKRVQFILLSLVFAGLPGAWVFGIAYISVPTPVAALQRGLS